MEQATAIGERTWRRPEFALLCPARRIPLQPPRRRLPETWRSRPDTLLRVEGEDNTPHHIISQHWSGPRANQPLFMLWYIQEFVSAIASSRCGGYRSSPLPGASDGSRLSKEELNMRRISVLSLFTMVLVFLSHRIGTVNFPSLVGADSIHVRALHMSAYPEDELTCHWTARRDREWWRRRLQSQEYIHRKAYCRRPITGRLGGRRGWETSCHRIVCDIYSKLHLLKIQPPCLSLGSSGFVRPHE